MGSFSSTIGGMAATVGIATGALTAFPVSASAANDVSFVACNNVNGPNGLIPAINAANNNTGPHTIILAPKCAYFLTTRATGINGLPVITGNVTLKGQGSVIRRFSATQFRLVSIARNGRLTGDDITFAGGDSLGNVGGAIEVQAGGFLQLSNSRVTQSTGAGGGALLNDSAGPAVVGTVRLFKTTIDNNTSPNGAGGAISNEGNLTIVGGLIGFNTATAGGGIFNLGRMSATSTDIVHNTATSAAGGIGGALANIAGNATVRSSRVQFNTSVTAGGGFSNGATLTVVGSRISDNRTGTATANVGGGFHQGPTGTTIISNSTVTRNAAGNGGGIFEAVGGTVKVFRILITNNHPNNCRPLGSVPRCSS
jgi:hypothetical protein